MNDFKPGLEGVVAVETAIAAPDREGGALRYRGYDIEDLVGRYPYENVWGLLVDDDLDSKMPDPEPYVPKSLTGTRPQISSPRSRISRASGSSRSSSTSTTSRRAPTSGGCPRR